MSTSCGNLLVFEVFDPVNMRRQGLQLGKCGVVIGGLGIAQRHIVERGFRKLGFHGYDGLRGCLGCFLTPTDQLEHVGDVLLIFFARLLKPCIGLEIIIAVRHAQPIRADIGQNLCRVVRVLRAGQVKRVEHANIVQVGHHALQRGSIVGTVNLRQPGFERFETARIYARLVHTRAIVVADDLFRAARGRGFVLGSLFQNLLQLVLRGFTGLPALAPAGHGRGNWMVRPPGAVGKLVEVGAGINCAVEVRRVDSVLRGRLRKQKRRAEQKNG